MRIRWLALGVMLAVACGGPSPPTAPPPGPAALPPPPAFVVGNASDLSVLAADASHVYWHDGEAFFRRPHGPDQPIERLFVSGSYVSGFALGRDDLFFLDDGDRLRALPKAGGAPSDLADGFAEPPVALAGDGDGVVVATGDALRRYSRAPTDRSYPLPGQPATLAVADGIAYATLCGDDTPTLVSVELASGKLTALSQQPELADATALAVSGDQVVAMLGDGVLAVPRTGGIPVRALSGAPYALAADDAGYAIAASQVIVAHQDGHAPRVIAHGTAEQTLPGVYLVAVGGAYAYYSSYHTATGAGLLHAAPRAVGATLMRLPRDAMVTATGGHGDRLYVAVERGDARTQVVEVTERKTRVIADPAPGYVDLVAAGADHLLIGVGGTLYDLDRDSGDTAMVAELAYLAPPVAHKGNVFWSQEAQVWARRRSGGDPVMVADALRLGDEVAADLRLFELGFADDHLYFVINLGAKQGLARADEAHHVEWVLSWPRVDQGVSLSTSLAIVGGAAYVHDRERLYRIPLTGGAATTAFEIARDDDERASAPREILGVLAAGDRLVVHTRGHATEQLREVPATGAPRLLWDTAPESPSLPFLTAGSAAVYFQLPDLAAIARVPLSAP